jgi:hypothetical protein
MKMVKSLWLLLTLFFMPHFCCAYIYEIKVLRTWRPEKQRYHYFIGLSDYHDKTHPANKMHVAAIEDALSRCKPTALKILVEDLSSSATHHDKTRCGNFAVNSRGGVLGGLATRCQAKGFDVDNMEYRYCRVSALGPVLNNLHSCPHDFPSVQQTPVIHLAQEVDAVMTEIEQYDDGKELNKIYKQSLHQAAPALKHFKKNAHAQLSVAEYLDMHSSAQERLEFLKHLLTFDSSLIDIKMVHAVLNAQACSHVLAISGGAHISRVSELLEMVGYEQVYATTVQLYKEYDLKKCVGSTIIDGSYALRPESIELDMLKSYLL